MAFDSSADNLTMPAYPTRDFFQVYLRAVDGDCPLGSGTTTTSTTSTTLPASSRTPIPANAFVLRPGRLAKLVAKGLTVNPVDPRANGGTLELSGTTGGVSYALPASGWKAVGRARRRDSNSRGRAVAWPC